VAAGEAFIIEKHFDSLKKPSQNQIYLLNHF